MRRLLFVMLLGLIAPAAHAQPTAADLLRQIELQRAEIAFLRSAVGAAGARLDQLEVRLGRNELNDRVVALDGRVTAAKQRLSATDHQADAVADRLKSFAVADDGTLSFPRRDNPHDKRAWVLDPAGHVAFHGEDGAVVWQADLSKADGVPGAATIASLRTDVTNLQTATAALGVRTRGLDALNLPQRVQSLVTTTWIAAGLETGAASWSHDMAQIEFSGGRTVIHNGFFIHVMGANQFIRSWRFDTSGKLSMENRYRDLGATPFSTWWINWDATSNLH